MFRIMIAGVLLAVSGVALADDSLDNLDALTQARFHDLSADLGAAVHFKQLAPAEPEGLIGFSLGVGLSGTKVNDDAAWQTATGGSDVSMIPMARVRVRKGLPLGFDIGGYYSAAPDSNIKAYGGELRYALIDGGVVKPAVGLRATYSKVSGVDNLDFHMSSVEVSISKGFGPFTPYGGVGYTWISSEANILTGLQREDFGKKEVFAGLNFGLAILDLAVEVNRIGDSTTYALNFGFGL